MSGHLSQRGYSLVELLVALGLSVATATSGIALVVSVVGHTRSQIHLAEMQQSARSAELATRPPR